MVNREDGFDTVVRNTQHDVRTEVDVGTRAGSVVRARTGRGLLAVIAMLAAAGCGGDDDAGGDTPDVASDVVTEEAAGEATAASGGGEMDELALGDPCELVPAASVAPVVGGDVTAETLNVGDGLPGATCAYTVAAGGTISLSITPDGAGFFDSYKDQAESAGGVEQVPDVGDEAFVFQDAEVVARTGAAMIQLQSFTSATTAATGGVEIVRLAVEAVSG